MRVFVGRLGTLVRSLRQAGYQLTTTTSLPLLFVRSAVPIAVSRPPLGSR